MFSYNISSALYFTLYILKLPQLSIKNYIHKQLAEYKEELCKLAGKIMPLKDELDQLDTGKETFQKELYHVTTNIKVIKDEIKKYEQEIKKIKDNNRILNVSTLWVQAV